MRSGRADLLGTTGRYTFRARQVPSQDLYILYVKLMTARQDRAVRPGGSLKEAEDVIAVLTSLAAFDRLHQGGRRPSASVVEILVRMAGAILQRGAQSPTNSEPSA